MNQEIEAKFLNVNHDELRQKLKLIGAELEHNNRLMRRAILDYGDGRLQKTKSSLRVRDEGDKITLTYKSYSNNRQYCQEAETTVTSFEGIQKVLEAIGLECYSYQETKREAWLLDDTEIVLDEWPWLDPYIEIEGKSEEAIKAVAAKLGFDWSEAAFGSVDTAYMAKYPKMAKADSIGFVPEVKFGSPLPKYLKDLL